MADTTAQRYHFRVEFDSTVARQGMHLYTDEIRACQKEAIKAFAIEQGMPKTRACVYRSERHLRSSERKYWRYCSGSLVQVGV